MRPQQSGGLRWPAKPKTFAEPCRGRRTKPPEESVGRAQESGLHPGGSREPLKDSEKAAEWPRGAGEVGAQPHPGPLTPPG